LHNEIVTAPLVPVRVESPGLAQTNISPTVPACEVCNSVANAVFDFLAQYQYHLSGEPRLQAELAERHGLCGPHTWQFQAMTASTDLCSGFAAVVERQAAWLRAAAERTPAGAPAGQRIGSALPTLRTCPACEVALRAARSTIQRIANKLTHDAASLSSLSAICLPHLQLLVGALPSPHLVQAVLYREADLLDRLAEDMRHFALKRDGLQRHLTTKEEIAAGERAVRVLIGSPRAQIGPSAMHIADNITPLVRRAG
jgi:hypothetical protein